MDTTSSEGTKSGVVYLGHIPRGFFENQMKGFFGQFGTVLRLRLSRSRKTAQSKGYAFIEFQFEEVAKIVADTMNNYMMFRKVLKCQFIPFEKVHKSMFKGRRKFTGKIEKNRKKHQESLSANVDESITKQKMKKLLQKEGKKRTLLTSLGVQYDYIGYKEQLQTAKACAADLHSKMELFLSQSGNISTDSEVDFNTVVRATQSTKTGGA